MVRKPVLALVALMAALAAPARAETSLPMALDGYVQIERVTIAADGERLVERADPDIVVPGDKLIFGTRFANVGPEPVEQFVVTNPVPPTVRLAPEADPALTVSVDGGEIWGRLAELEVVDEAGNRRPAQPEDVTHVRWTLPSIGPAESGRLEFPVTVR